jgi:biopolymer transport protein ExbD
MTIRRQNRTRSVQRPATLNLVSLMDIFTILVFFLMVNGSDVEILETSNDIKLPDSVAEQKPEDRISILISSDDVIVQGRMVAQVSDILQSGDGVSDGLAAELLHQAERKKERLQNPAEFQGEVTIMGDRELHYDLLKRVMQTCQAAEFTRIALAVNQVSEDA